MESLKLISKKLSFKINNTKLNFTMNKLIWILLILIITTESCKKDNGTPDDNSNPCDGVICQPDLLTNETAATLSGSIIGEYSTIYTYAEPDSPFTDGMKAKFTLTSNNELIIEIEGEECITLKNPAFREGMAQSNYFFKDDCDRNICYSVSENSSGLFNEVNIQPLEGIGWYGQFVEE
jgi:hypothetical protein